MPREARRAKRSQAQEEVRRTRAEAARAEILQQLEQGGLTSEQAAYIFPLWEQFTRSADEGPDLADDSPQSQQSREFVALHRQAWEATMIHEQRRLLDLEQRMRHHPEVHPWEDSG